MHTPCKKFNCIAVADTGKMGLHLTALVRLNMRVKNVWLASTLALAACGSAEYRTSEVRCLPDGQQIYFDFKLDPKRDEVLLWSGEEGWLSICIYSSECQVNFEADEVLVEKVDELSGKSVFRFDRHSGRYEVNSDSGGTYVGQCTLRGNSAVEGTIY